jgi:hypothetical protein
MVMAQTDTVANGGTIFFATANVASTNGSTTANVFLRKDFAGTLSNGNFYFYTIP